jgi:NitT/TauT family transport system substrate-binding protein
VIHLPSRGRTALLSACLAVASIAVLAVGTTGQAANPTISVAVATNQSDVLTYIAKQLGYFKDQGIDVNLLTNTGGSATTPLVVSGRVDLAAFSTTAPITVGIQGQDTSIVYGIEGGGVGGSMLGNGTTVKSVDDLKSLSSCKIASSPPGTGSYGEALIYVKRYNQKCDIVPLATPASELAALASGQVQAVVGGYSFLAPGSVSLNKPILINTTDPKQRAKFFGPGFVEVGFWGMSSNLNGKRESVVRFIRALQKARDFLLNSSPDRVTGVLRGVSDFSSFDDASLKNIIVKSFQAYVPNGGRNGYIDKGRWAFALSKVALYGLNGFDPSGSSESYAKQIDMSYYTQALGTPTEFNTALTAKGEPRVPKNAAGASATFSATVNPGARSNVLRYTASWQGLSGTPTSIVVSAGAKGQAGRTLVKLCTSCVNGQSGLAVISKSAYAALQHASFVNVTTAKNPKGEVRGQLRKIAG